MIMNERTNLISVGNNFMVLVMIEANQSENFEDFIIIIENVNTCT